MVEVSAMLDDAREHFEEQVQESQHNERRTWKLSWKLTSPWGTPSNRLFIERRRITWT